MPGEGPAEAGLMVVGEAPGRSEDATGRPFVGRAGRLLGASLESVGLALEQAFITNVVKCRPPGNRIPTEKEITTCKSLYLHRQVRTVNPKVVLLLGRTAAKAVIQVKTLREVRGKPRTDNDRTYLATYHPAAVLRNPRLKRSFLADLRKVKSLHGQNNA